MADPIHIVEPTLQDHAGHCHSFIAALCGAGRGGPFEVWASRRATNLFETLPQVTLRRHFRRRLRKLQAYFLYRRLLREPGRIFVATAGTADLMILDWLSRPLPPGKVCAYVHWIRPSASKLRRLERIAERQPNLQVIGPTETVTRVFEAAGFRQVRVAPYPITTYVRAAGGGSFRHVLYAGAARRDKGFDRLVDLVELLRERGSDLPVVAQACGDYFGKVDSETAGDLRRLARSGYSCLRTIADPLGTPDFLALFSGAICLQLYCAEDFADRVSVVTLDALSSGAPIVTVAGTWMARQVERFEAGCALEEASGGELLLEAIEKIRRDYHRYRSNAIRAGETLQREHDPARLYEIIVDSAQE
ncbi:MAG TPA: glycosyltransferase [Planctomycetota bacterium]|nr:glycosyltransferase [Planctomycetota bacterium]